MSIKQNFVQNSLLNSTWGKQEEPSFESFEDSKIKVFTEKRLAESFEDETVGVTLTSSIDNSEFNSCDISPISSFLSENSPPEDEMPAISPDSRSFECSANRFENLPLLSASHTSPLPPPRFFGRSQISTPSTPAAVPQPKEKIDENLRNTWRSFREEEMVGLQTPRRSSFVANSHASQNAIRREIPETFLSRTTSFVIENQTRILSGVAVGAFAATALPMLAAGSAPVIAGATVVGLSATTTNLIASELQKDCDQKMVGIQEEMFTLRNQIQEEYEDVLNRMEEEPASEIGDLIKIYQELHKKEKSLASKQSNYQKVQLTSSMVSLLSGGNPVPAFQGGNLIETVGNMSTIVGTISDVREFGKSLLQDS